MDSFLHQDWFTTKVDPAKQTDIAQAESDWLDLSLYEDVFAWLDVSMVLSGGGVVSMSYETSPTRDARLFVPLDPTFAVFPLVATTVSKVTPMTSMTMTTPLARWFRWRLTVTGATTAWGGTFRMHVVASRATDRKQGPGCDRPPRVRVGDGGANALSPASPEALSHGRRACIAHHQ